MQPWARAVLDMMVGWVDPYVGLGLVSNTQVCLANRRPALIAPLTMIMALNPIYYLLTAYNILRQS